MKKTRWRMVGLLLAFLVLILAGCGSKKEKEETKEETKAEESQKSEESKGEESAKGSETAEKPEIPNEVTEGPIYDFAVALRKGEGEKLLGMVALTGGLKPEAKSFQEELNQQSLFTDGYTDESMYTMYVADNKTSGKIMFYNKDAMSPDKTYEFDIRDGKPSLSFMETTMEIRMPYEMKVKANGVDLVAPLATIDTSIQYEINVEKVLPGVYDLEFSPNIWGLEKAKTDSSARYTPDDIDTYNPSEKLQTDSTAMAKEFAEALIQSCVKPDGPDKLEKYALPEDQIKPLRKGILDSLKSDELFNNYKGDGSDKLALKELSSNVFGVSSATEFTGTFSFSIQCNDADSTSDTFIRLSFKLKDDGTLEITEVKEGI